MAAMRVSILKQLCSIKSASRFDVRPSAAYASKFYHTRESNNVQRFDLNGFRILGSSSANLPQYSKGFHLRNSSYGGSLSFTGINTLVSHRFFSSTSEGKGSTPGDAVGTNGASVSDGSVGGDAWVPKLKEAWETTVEAVKYTGEKVKEASNEAAPHIQQLLDSHPYLRDVIVPVGGTLAGTLLAWSLLPRLFRRFHKYSVEGPGALLSQSSIWGPVPYEQSFWGALEAPVRYFVTFLAFLTVLVLLYFLLFLR